MATKGKDEFEKTTPISKKLQKLRSESSNIGVVTSSPVIHNMKKKKSTKHHTNTHRSSSGDTSSAARKIESNKTTTKVPKNDKKRSSKSPSDSDTSSVSSSDDTSSVAPRKLEFDASSVAIKLESNKTTTNDKKRSIKSQSDSDTSSVSSSDDTSSVAPRKPEFDTSSVAIKLESNKTTTKVSKNKNKKKRSNKSLSRGDTPSKTHPQLIFGAHQMDWTNSIATRTEVRKYQNTDHIDETQEAILPYLLNKFKPNDIKLAFAVLISKSDSNTDSYYPLPIVKAKLIESFIKLIFVTKSLMVSSSKKPTR